MESGCRTEAVFITFGGPHAHPTRDDKLHARGQRDQPAPVRLPQTGHSARSRPQLRRMRPYSSSILNSSHKTRWKAANGESGMRLGPAPFEQFFAIDAVFHLNRGFITKLLVLGLCLGEHVDDMLG